MVPNFELFSVDNHRIVAGQSAFFLVGLTGFKPYCRDFAQSSISTNLIVGQACVFIASCSINEEV